MSARYLEIKPLQEPYDLGVDEQGRSKTQFNIAVKRTAIVGPKDFEDELVKILEDASVVVSTGSGRNVFVGTNAKIPTGDGPFVSIIVTSGVPPIQRQGEINAYRQPTALIVVRATSYTVARAKAGAAYDALTAVRNQTITP